MMGWFFLSDTEKLQKKIASLPNNDHKKCGDEIRRLHQKMKDSSDVDEGKLLNDLKGVASRGLSEDLKKRMTSKQLNDEVLELVLRKVANLPQLAQYLAEHKEGLETIRAKFHRDLEVLFWLKENGIDLTKEWVEKLSERASSFQSLLSLTFTELERCCQGAKRVEMVEVQRLVEVSESIDKQLSIVLNSKSAYQDIKKETEEKLKTTKEWMKNAKDGAKDAKDGAKDAKDGAKDAKDGAKDAKDGATRKPREQVIKKVAAGVATLKLTSYKKDLEIVANASKGRALFGIYHSNYDPPQPAEKPIILLPKQVQAADITDPPKKGTMTFSREGAASRVFQTVESTSTKVDDRVAKFYELDSIGNPEIDETIRTSRASTSEGSVLEYIWNAKKSFKIDPENIKLCMTAKMKAWSIIKDRESEDERKVAARRFLHRYGSHLPAGLHSLGGVFFSIVDIKRGSHMETSLLTKRAANELKLKIPAGYLGGVFDEGASVEEKHILSSGGTSWYEDEQERTTFTYKVEAMGPPVTDPEFLEKLLPYNSTWAVIDRGPPEEYKSVWDLIETLGGEFEEVARILKEAWSEKEEEKKDAWEKNLTWREMDRLKNKHLKGDPEVKGLRPTNGTPHPTSNRMSQREAYDKGIEHIVQNPGLNICEIKYQRGVLGYFEGYLLTCWEAPSDHPMTFVESGDSSVLFFSKSFFKWKEQLSF